MACNGLKMGSFHLIRLGTPNGLGIIFRKTQFSPIFDPLFVRKHPIFKAFWDFRMSKMGHHELKACQKHLFWHSMWSRSILKKVNFFCTRWTHFGTHLFGWVGTSYSLPQPTGPRYGGLGVD